MAAPSPAPELPSPTPELLHEPVSKRTRLQIKKRSRWPRFSDYQRINNFDIRFPCCKGSAPAGHAHPLAFEDDYWSYYAVFEGCAPVGDKHPLRFKTNFEALLGELNRIAKQ